MLSATEAKIGTVYHNEKADIPIRTILQEIGHLKDPLPARPIITQLKYSIIK